MTKQGRRHPVSDRLPEAYAYTLIKSAPGVNPDDVELPDVAAVEVVILWESNVLHVDHLTPPRSFYVGEERKGQSSCDYCIPADRLGIARAPLVLSDEESTRVVILPGARGTVELAGAPAMSIDDAIRRGCTELYEKILGAHQVMLPPGGKVRMERGGFVFQIAAVAAGKPTNQSVFDVIEAGTVGHLALSVAAHAGLFAAMALFVPPLGLTDREEHDRDQRYLIQHYLEASAARELEITPDDSSARADAAERGWSGQRASNEEGSVGRPNAAPSGHRFAVKGPADNVDPHLARRAEAAEFGMIGLLQGGVAADPNAPTAPWGRLESLGKDPLSALGNMWGDSIGDSLGNAGLSLSGTGEGGGRQGEGIGIDRIGTIGGGDGASDMPSRQGRLAGTHPTAVPQMRVGTSVVNGHLPSEVIQRIVRQNYGRFRFCYEQGLRTNPSLAGRVATRFIIGRDGAVMNATNGGSDLPDASVVECVTRTFYTLSFPPPEFGIVSVVYPIAFSPGP